jgi:hypothetical protein
MRSTIHTYTHKIRTPTQSKLIGRSMTAPPLLCTFIPERKIWRAFKNIIFFSCFTFENCVSLKLREVGDCNRAGCPSATLSNTNTTRTSLGHVFLQILRDSPLPVSFHHVWFSYHNHLIFAVHSIVKQHFSLSLNSYLITLFTENDQALT